MNKLTKVLLALSISFTVFAFVLFVVNSAKQASGSTIQGQDYFGTTTDQTWTTLIPKVLKGSSDGSKMGGALAQVTITTAGTGSLIFYDATTTNINARTGNTATSTLVLANFAVTTTVGTYTFDRTFNNGLIVMWTGTNAASSTITWR